MVPPERIELSSPAPEAGTLSAELQGHSAINDSTALGRPTTARQSASATTTSLRHIRPAVHSGTPATDISLLS